jgi:hypothetical protein
VLPFHTPQIDVRLQWFEKTACRLPEAFWFSFAPVGLQADSWLFEKLGQMISPLDVVSKGARHLHAIERGVFYQDQHTALQILSPDVPLVSPGKPSLLDFHNQLPEMDGGVHFNLYNNVWGTNFPMWFEDDALFRFSLIFASGK